MNNIATFGVPSALPVCTWLSSPTANFDNCVAISAVELATSAKRFENDARPTAAVKQTSSRASFVSSFEYASAVLCSAASDVALRVNRPVRATLSVLRVDGAETDSTIAWELVPLNPKELTDATACSPTNGIIAVGTVAGIASSGTRGFSFLKCKLPGTALCCSERITFIRPAAPAAASRWPILVLTEPNIRGRVRPSLRTAAKDWTSIGSPSAVPVP